MRLPVPERFKPRPAALFILLVFLGQQVTGTDIQFSLLTSAYLTLFVVGFNIGGGLLYPSGAFIFFNGVLTAILGLCFKILLGVPGEKFLLNGNKTMLCYCAGMLSMVVAIGVSTRLRTRTGLLANIAAGPTMKRAAVGCLFFGIFLQVLTATSSEGSLGSAFRQINHFVPVAILLATTYEIKRSDGKKSVNWIVLTAIAFLFSLGLLSFGKENMFLGVVTWMVAAVSLRYDFGFKQIAALVLAGTFLVYYMVPYSQYVRTFSTESRSENFATALHYLSDLSETRALFLASEEKRDITGEPHLFGTPEGFMDRLNMLAYDDALISYTDEGYVFGLLPTFYSYANIIPHFIWAGKPSFAYGNNFGRELGVITEDDLTTGISFSPVGDAYHEATWFGLLVVWPLVIFLFFFTTDSLTGSARDSPWALLPITLVSHTAPEGLMSGTIFLTTYGILGLLITVWFAKYLLPIAAGVITGAERTRVRALPDLRPAIRRNSLQPAVPAPGADAAT